MPPPIETHENAISRWLKPNGVGVEIGAFTTPIPGLNPFYVDRFAEYAGQPCLADYWGDACHLPFRSNSLDYVASSHVLEHVANPVAALLDWHRVLAHGGVIYMVIPDRPFTFDHPRELTDPEHMWADYENEVNQYDGTHIYDFVDKIDWPMYRPDVAPEDLDSDRTAFRDQLIYVLEHKKDFNMHFHVFEKSNPEQFIQLIAKKKKLSWKIKGCVNSFLADCPNGILMAIRVNKGWIERFKSWVNRFQTRRKKTYPLLPSAKPISASDKMRLSC
jgi:SAM-dependent methyltransferase